MGCEYFYVKEGGEGVGVWLGIIFVGCFRGVFFIR